MLTNLLAHTFLLCIAIVRNKNANDNVMYIIIIHRISVVTVHVL